MAVSKTQDWAAIVSTKPTGTLTVGPGTNKTVILVSFAERTQGDFTASCGAGGVSATGVRKTAFEFEGTSATLVINTWYWNQAALDSWSGNTISHTEDPVVQHQGFTYATFASTDQAGPVFTSAAVSTANTLAVGTVGSSADYKIVNVARDGHNRDLTNWDNLSEQIDLAINSVFRIGLGDGQTDDTSTLITGDGISDSILLQGVVIRAYADSPTGTGDIVAPVPTVAGSADVGVNDLKSQLPESAGVGERTIVWQSGVNLVAPKATTSVATQQFGGAGSIEPVYIIAAGIGERQIDASGSTDGFIGTILGTGEREVTGTGSCSVTLSTFTNVFEYDATWYVIKSVNF